MSRSIAVGALSLIAAGVIGGGVAVGLSAQDGPQQPVEVRQVVQTATSTPQTTATAAPSATATTTARTAPQPAATTTTTTTARPRATASRASKVTPQVVETTPEPVTTTPETTRTVHTPPPVVPGNGPAFCGGQTTCTSK